LFDSGRNPGGCGGKAGEFAGCRPRDSRGSFALFLGWTLTIRRLPPAGLKGERWPDFRLDFNDPPVATGGIREWVLRCFLGLEYKE
jgi:hypothetical protein